MALPGLALPGLDLAEAAAQPEEAASTTVNYHNLAKETEYRFESSFTRPITIKVVSGNAEYFGTELAPSTIYTFKGAKGAVFSWLGCTIEVTGEPEAEYVAEETPMSMYANVHFGLENLRSQAAMARAVGPRVLVVGPEDAGKTSLVRILSSYASKAGRQPCVVNFDPEQGLLTPPGSFTATTFGSVLDVEEGWGSSPISGPSILPVKMPLVYQFGTKNPGDQEKLFKAKVTRMAVAVTGRLLDDAAVKATGCIIDTAGSLAQAKGGGYDLIAHIVSEFTVNVILTLGSEKLYSDMRRRFAKTDADEPVAVVKLDKSGGCVDRDDAYMKQLRQHQIKEYFFGTGSTTLSPYSQLVDFDHVIIYKINDAMVETNSAFNAGNEDDDDEYEPGSAFTGGTGSKDIYTRETPSLGLQNSLLAVTHADPNDSETAIRDSSIMGYIYVSDVEETKKKLKILSPVGGRIPYKAMVRGNWPEDVVGLLG